MSILLFQTSALTELVLSLYLQGLYVPDVLYKRLVRPLINLNKDKWKV